MSLLKSQRNEVFGESRNSSISISPSRQQQERRRRCGGGGTGGFWSWLAACCCGRGTSHQDFFTSNNNNQTNTGIRGWCSNRCYRPVINFWFRFSRSILYVIMYIAFSLFLLFGSAIQDLAGVGEAGNLTFDILRTAMLIFFVQDMILKCITEKDYFEMFCPFFGINSEGPGNIGRDGVPLPAGTANMHIAENTRESNLLSCCSFGSFLFWCDFLSTLAILYDLSYVNPARDGVRTMELSVQDGKPVDGFEIYNRLTPVDLEFSLLVVIARTARCARFIQSRAVVAMNSKINWFWAFEKLNPFYYYEQFQVRRQQQHIAVPTLGVGGNDHGNAKSREDDKKSPWGVLQIGILAAVHAQAEAEAREANEEAKKKGVFGSLALQTKKALRSLGFMSNEKKRTARHEAAIKIQRAWRNHVRFETSNDGADFADVALMSDIEDPSQILASTRSNYVNPLDGSVRQRSALASFSQFNAHAGGRLNKADIKASGRDEREIAPESRFQSQTGKGRESQVGSDMRELTGQRVAIGVLFALLCTVLFTYTETNTTQPTTMLVLHEQTKYLNYRYQALIVARETSVPALFQYQAINATDVIQLPDSIAINDLRSRDILQISVSGDQGVSVGWFDYSSDTRQEAWVEVVSTVFIIAIWFFGVNAFFGPVALLVINPIERMVRLLGMLMLDPLGYQSTARFKKFLLEEDSLIKNTRWTKEVLKGMETSFLMSTILRIGSLMKVGFGTAGVEIIRKSLEKGQGKLISEGSTVSCIFLFCDIRQFTDATEQLQEEVFVFTNQIAAVVHSICHSYNGAANKNVGDAFLLSWSLDDSSSGFKAGSSSKPSGGVKTKDKKLRARSNQADKALLSVIRICISLQYDKFYLEPLSEGAKQRLKTKLDYRKGPIVQMGFGLHAGKAVQGAIGSERKIDATYVSEAVERAEFLEASTKKYGLNMVMSDSFHKLLHQNTRRRCRMIDRIFIVDEDEDEDEDDRELRGEEMELFTFDMDVEAIRRPLGRSHKRFGENDTNSDSGSAGDPSLRSRRKGGDRRSHGGSSSRVRNRRRNSSMRTSNPGLGASEELQVSPGHPKSAGGFDGHGLSMGSPSIGQPSISSFPSNDDVGSAGANYNGPPELILPNGPALYSHNVWQSPDMRRIREKYVQGLFFQKFHGGLQAYYNKDWDTAQICFQTVLEGVDDGPSRYFLAEMKKHNGRPPKDFLPYTVV